MNCEPGDLAVIVNSYNAINIGRVVKCIRLFSEKQFVSSRDYCYAAEECWVTDPPAVAWHGVGNASAIPDAFLRPIRDNDGEDETLTWAPVPKKVSA